MLQTAFSLLFLEKSITMKLVGWIRKSDPARRSKREKKASILA